ncbi:MAG: glycosyltransferase [Pirellulales bacterium]
MKRAMELTLCIPAWRRYDLLVNAVRSAVQGRRKPDRILILDNGGGLTADELAFARDRLCIERLRINMGVAGSWNYFLCKGGSDMVVMCNDDVTLGADALELLEAASEANPDYLLYHCMNRDGHNNWCLFLQRTCSIEIVGLYDTNFWPAYFEDNDYDYRQHLLGYRCFPVQCDYQHVLSASRAVMTPDELQQAHAFFARNARYYQAKWGGPPGREKYLVPFNRPDYYFAPQRFALAPPAAWE